MNDTRKTKSQLIEELKQLRVQVAELSIPDANYPFKSEKHSEVRMKALSEASFEAIFLSEKGICQDQNLAAERIFGYTREEAIGRSGMEWIVEEDRELVIKNMLSGYEKTYEVTALRKDGTKFPCEIQAKMSDFQNRSIRITALRDITDRKQAEEELRRYKHIVSNSTDMLALLDNDFIYLATNQSYLDNFGLTTEELIGNSVSEVFGEEFYESVIKPNALNCLAGIDVNYQDWFEFPNRGKVYMDINYYPYIDQDKNIKGFVVNGRDISERKLFEDEIHHKDFILHSASSVIATADLKGVMTYVNPAFLKAWKFDRQEEILGYQFSEFWQVDEKLEEIMSALMGKEGVWSGELVAKRKDGSLFDVHVSAATVFDYSGNPIALTSTSIDISDRKLVEKERENLIVELQEAIDNIKVLGGLIPICAKCKKIRDDEGYWNHVEVYIAEHSEAEFTHGICPKCDVELYGDKNWLKNKPE
jgi:PAS domain S-box-containing protein